MRLLSEWLLRVLMLLGRRDAPSLSGPSDVASLSREERNELADDLERRIEYLQLQARVRGRS